MTPRSSPAALFALLGLALARAAAAFDPADALAMARLEQAVYCGEDRFERWDVGDSIAHGPKVDTARLQFVRRNYTDASAGVGKMVEPPGCFVAIKGTTGTLDSLLDASFWLTHFGREGCEGCQVEKGFLVYYESMKQGIFDALERFGCKEEPLYLVGHSLGAAAITYAFYDLLDAGYKVRHMHALESPRPGNMAFAKALAAKAKGVDAWRVAHYQDLVVHLPPEPLRAFEHALPEVYFPQRVGTAFRECGREEHDCSDQWRPWHLTMKDHCWYADINPCSCDNKTRTPPPPRSRSESPLHV